MSPPSCQSRRRFLEAARVAAWRDGRTFDPAVVAAYLQVRCCGPLLAWAVGAGLVDRAADGTTALTAAGAALAALA